MSHNRRQKRIYDKLVNIEKTIIDAFVQGMKFDENTNKFSIETQDMRVFVERKWLNACLSNNITQKSDPKIFDSVKRTMILFETEFILQSQYNSESVVEEMNKLYKPGISPEDLAILVISNNKFDA